MEDCRSALFAPVCIGSFAAPRTATVEAAAGGLRVHAAPSAAAPVLAHLPDGAEVQVLFRRRGWAQLRCIACEGYARDAHLTLHWR